MPLVGYIPFKILTWEIPAAGTNLPDSGNDPFGETEDSKIYILADNASLTDSANTNPTQLTMGQVAQPFTQADQFQTTYTLSGPALLRSGPRVNDSGVLVIGGPDGGTGSVADSAFLGDINDMPIKVVDVPTLALYLLSSYMQIPQLPFDKSAINFQTHASAMSSLLKSNETPYQWPVLRKVSLQFNESGLNSTLEWAGKVTNQPSMSYEAISQYIARPLRKCNWYDFIVKYPDQILIPDGIAALNSQLILPTEPIDLSTLGTPDEGSEASGLPDTASSLDGETSEEGNEDGGEETPVPIEYLDITLKSANIDINLNYDTPTWIQRSQEPVYFLQDISINWSLTGVFDFSRFHIAPHRHDAARSFAYEQQMAEYYANYLYDIYSQSKNQLVFKITPVNYISGLGGFADALEDVFNNFFNTGSSLINLGYKNNSFITENSVSHRGGASEITVSGITTLS